MIETVICLLVAVAFGGLAWTMAGALRAGAEEYAGTFSSATARDFEDLFLFIPARRIAELGWAAAGAAFLLGFLLFGSLASAAGIAAGLLAALLCGTGALQLPRLILWALRQRRLRRFNLQLVDALVNMSNALKAGFSISQAFDAVVKTGLNPVAQEFEVLQLQQGRLGMDLSQALTQMVTRVGSDDLALAVEAIEVARKTGGNLTEVFEKIAGVIRERMRIENRIRTLTAQGRLQGIIVGAMPILIGALLFLVDPEMMRPFFHSMFGLATMVLAAFLVALGGLMVRKIVRIDI